MLMWPMGELEANWLFMFLISNLDEDIPGAEYLALETIFLNTFLV